MNALSLFSGIGGIDLACEWAGIKTVAMCEREPFCQKVLRKHWPDVPIYDDVCTLTKERLEADGIGTIDIVFSGDPCQPYSHAGKREGEGDDRFLWPEVDRLLESIRPRWIVRENVAGNITLGLDNVLTDLENLGYSWQPFVIPAAAVGSPQRRDRVFVVAHTKGYVARRLPVGTQTEFSGFTFSSENVAYPESERRGEEREYQLQRPEKWTSSSCRNTFSRSIESKLGGIFDGVSRRLDKHRWPSYWGEQQQEWEPPRISNGVKNRGSRLKALGNSVNPYQIYPILAAIKQIDDMMHESA